MKMFISRIIAVLSIYLCTITANAYDFMQDGLCYDKNSDGTSVSVTCQNTSTNNYPSINGELTIPASVSYHGRTYSVTSIGRNAFKFCSGLTSVIIPNSVTSIDEYAFYWCSGLKNVTIPNSVTKIGSSAFSICQELLEITIPNSVKSIGDDAFYGCTSLTSAYIGKSVSSIGNSSFFYCRELEQIVVEQENTKYDSRNDCNAIIETSTNTLITGCKTTIIPNSVWSISDYAFYACTITELVIPNSITSIGKHPFSYCSELGLIIVEQGNTKYDSRNDCNAIVETSTNTLITGCKTTIIPKSVTAIGEGAFLGCTSLTEIVIPNSITYINKNTFAYCTGLTNVTIPNSVTSIGDFAFQECTGLGNVTIPNSVTSIGDFAFQECTGLGNVTIPNSVTSIGYGAFSGCTHLYGIYSYPDPSNVSLGSSVFHDVDHNYCRLHVLPVYHNAYKSAAQWKEFSRIYADLTESQIIGDVDGNGIIDVEDVNAAINIILKLNSISDYSGSCDMDGNGIIDVEDVNAIINKILHLA